MGQTLKTKIFGGSKHIETMKGLRNQAKQAKYDYKKAKIEAKTKKAIGLAKTKAIQSAFRNTASAVASGFAAQARQSENLSKQIGMYTVDKGDGTKTTDTNTDTDTDPNSTYL